jgi:hypothetical protein
MHIATVIHPYLIVILHLILEKTKHSATTADRGIFPNRRSEGIASKAIQNLSPLRQT